MAYYLTDPYYYLPKCYPFIGGQLGHTPRIYSNRATSLGKHIETRSITNRLQVTSKVYSDVASCQYKLIKSKYLMTDTPNVEQLSLIVADRKNKQSSLRKMAHRFPDFIKNKDLIQEITDSARKSRLV